MTARDSVLTTPRRARHVDDRADRSRSLPYRSRIELRSPDLIVAALRALPINPFERTNSRPQATFPKSHFADMNSPLNSAPLAPLKPSSQVDSRCLQEQMIFKN